MVSNIISGFNRFYRFLAGVSVRYGMIG